MIYTQRLAESTKTFTLRDGRLLGLTEVGDPAGSPLFFFHGWPGSRVGVLTMDNAAKACGVRVFGVDRPGMGMSSPKPGRTLLDWPDDVAELADQWELDRFAVAGISGGGPYALACAMKLDQRINSAGIIAGMGPLAQSIQDMRPTNQRLFGLAARAPWLLRFFFWLGIGRFAKDLTQLEKLIPGMIKDLPEPDMEVLARPEVQQKLALELQEAFRQGARWVVEEGTLYTQPWGFSVEDLPPRPLYLWHGDLDRNVPVGMGRAMAAGMPHVRAKFASDHGHISLFAHELDSILQTLRDAALHQAGPTV